MSQSDRLARVNSLIVVIGSTGRRFMYHDGCFAYMSRDERGRVWYHDPYSKRAIYTHYHGRWRGFTEGGTMHELVVAFREYILRGARLHRFAFGPWPAHFGDGDVWAYGSDMASVRQVAAMLGITASENKPELDGLKPAPLQSWDANPRNH